MSYGILAWANTSHANMNKTGKLQKRAIRTINKSGFKSHTDPIDNRLPLSFNSTFQFSHQIQNILTARQTNLLHIKLPLYTFPHIGNKWSSMIPNNSSRA